jgi:hypothetical protein
MVQQANTLLVNNFSICYHINIYISAFSKSTKSSVKFNPENDINVKLQIFNFTFHAITSISSIRICHEHQRLEFIYHTPFIFLGLVTSTVIFSTEDSCWHSRASQCDLQHDIRHTMAFFCLSEKCADAVHSIPENRSA